MQDGGRLVVKTATVELDASYASQHVGVIPGRHVLVQVTDSGGGMDTETQSRVFDPFFTTKEEGTGLGLATVHGIVNQSGGHIWLYSELGIGTTFKIYLPSAGTPVIATTPTAPTHSLEGNETILLVEDAEFVRAIVAEILEPHGYTILAESNGADALAIAQKREGAIDLLLTDVVMPGMNGRELAESLTRQYPDVKVLFSSGYPADTLVRNGIAEGTTRFIEKPYLPVALARAVREILDEDPDSHSDRRNSRQTIDTR
jgi:CheY-like chemotaxis protein